MGFRDRSWPLSLSPRYRSSRKICGSKMNFAAGRPRIPVHSLPAARPRTCDGESWLSGEGTANLLVKAEGVSRIRRAQSGAKFDNDAGRREKFVRNRSKRSWASRAHQLRNQPLRRRWIHRAG